MQSIFVENGRDTIISSALGYYYYLVENSPYIKRALIFAIQLYIFWANICPYESKLIHLFTKMVLFFQSVNVRINIVQLNVYLPSSFDSIKLIIRWQIID